MSAAVDQVGSVVTSGLVVVMSLKPNAVAALLLAVMMLLIVIGVAIPPAADNPALIAAMVVTGEMFNMRSPPLVTLAPINVAVMSLLALLASSK